MKVQDYLNKKREAKKPSALGSQKTDRPTAAATVRLPDVPLGYFDSARGCWWVQNGRGGWIPHTETAYKRILRHRVFASVTVKEELARAVDEYLMHAALTDDVAFVQPVAGFLSGVHTVMGQRILCPTGPNLIKPRDGKCPTFKAFVHQLLGDVESVFFAWIKAALQSLYGGSPFRPGQMLVLAGPRGCGKSLLQNIVTEIFGGRMAKPYRYMSDKTQFNSDLIGSEHLLIEDSAASRELKLRRQFGAQLKEMVAGETQSLHKKGADALMVSPFSRITLSVNDEPENLMVLPPLDESIEDKVIILRCSPATFNYPADDLKARQKWRESVSAELPAFLRWLQLWKIPARMIDQRYGITHYHDPVILQSLRDLQPEMALWNLIHFLQIWGIDNDHFLGSATELEELLLSKDKTHRVEKLLYFDTSCGVYLTRLMKIFPSRIRWTEHFKGKRLYEICHPDRSFSV